LSDTDVDADGDGCLDSSEDTDDDGDGVADGTDNCPLVFNPSQLDTFPVIPNGVGDCCDPGTPGYPACSP
jgi:hypothetical protein